MNLDGGSAQNFRDYDSTVRDVKRAKRAKLRATIEAAALKVRSRDPGRDSVDGQASVDGVDQTMPSTATRSLTKQERLARNTGSEKERASTRDTVGKAAARVAAEHPDINLSAPDVRTALEKLRQRNPGKSIAEIIAQAEKWDAMMKDDPVAGRETLLEHYARLAPENFAEFKAPTYDKGTRGAVQRARQDHEDAQQLRDAQAKYGAHLPHILQQLERFDSSLRENPAAASARIAVGQGAPVTQRQVPAYEAEQAQKTQKKAHAQMGANILKGVQLAIHHGHIPGDEDSLNEIAAVLESPRFKFRGKDNLETLIRAAQIATHPEHQPITPRKGTGKAAPRPPARRDPGSLSISGSPGPGQGGRAHADRGTGSIRDSIARVRAAM